MMSVGRKPWGFLFLLLGSWTLSSLDAQLPPPVESQDLDAAQAPVDSWGEVDQESDLERLERRAEERFAQDDLEAAIVLYRQLADRFALDEQKVQALKTVAWIEHLMGEDRGGGDLQALETLTNALSLIPDHPFRAELYNERFRELYLEAQRMAIAERETLASVAMAGAGEKMRAKDYEGARLLYDEALEHQRDLPEALYNRALVDLYLNRRDEAMSGFQRLIALSDKIDTKMRALALTNLGYVYTIRGQNTEAVDTLREAVELDPNYALAWSYLGVARRRLGLKIDAATAFRRAHELQPDDPGIMNNLGLAYLDAEDWIAAVALYKKATETAPKNPGLWVNLGRAQLGMGNPAGLGGIVRAGDSRRSRQQRRVCRERGRSSGAPGERSRAPRGNLAASGSGLVVESLSGRRLDLSRPRPQGPESPRRSTRSLGDRDQPRSDGGVEPQ